MAKFLIVILASLSSSIAVKHNKGPHYKVHCTHDNLKIDIVKHEDISDIYLQHLKEYPDPTCKPEIVDSRATFNLRLSEYYKCMLTKVVNSQTGRTVYYQHVVLEFKDQMVAKQNIMIKCDMGMTPNNNSSYDSEVEQVSLVKRQADFENFREDYDVQITDTITGEAPYPILQVGVRQNGALIDDQLNVKPGTPLKMEVYLDSVSADVYGLLVTGLEVTDTGDQKEPILVNGCSVDPYLFENFATNDGDFLNAQFRAFKFPESSFVMFRGTVNVCLDTCNPVRCSNGQLGYGRRRRDVSSTSEENKVYTISMSTIIKMECDDCEKAKYLEKDSSSLREKVEYKHALFEEFGSTRFAYFESGQGIPTASFVSVILVTIVALWIK